MVMRQPQVALYLASVSNNFKEYSKLNYIGQWRVKPPLLAKDLFLHIKTCVESMPGACSPLFVCSVGDYGLRKLLISD